MGRGFLTILKDITITIDRLGEVAPVQGYGEINGLPYYFRFRMGSYSFSVAAEPDMDPVDVRVTGHGYRGVYDWDGDMYAISDEEAVLLLTQCIADYLITQILPEDGEYQYDADYLPPWAEE